MKGRCYASPCLWTLTFVGLIASACSPAPTAGRRETAAAFESRLLARGGGYGITGVSLTDRRMILAVNRHLRLSLAGDPHRAERLASGFLKEFEKFRGESDVALEFHYQGEPVLIARTEEGSVVLTRFTLPSEPPASGE